MMASGSADKTIKLWDADRGELLHTLSGNAGAVNNVAWSPDSRTVAGWSNETVLKLWDGNSRIVGLKGATAEGLVTVTDTFQLWDAHGGQLMCLLNGDDHFAEWSPNGRLVAKPAAGRSVNVWDAWSGRLLRTLSGHADDIHAIAWSPNSRTLASASDDQTVKLWDADSGQLLETLAHSHYVDSMAWSPTEMVLASISGDGIVRLWDTRHGKLLWATRGPKLCAVIWSPDGKRLAIKEGEPPPRQGVSRSQAIRARHPRFQSCHSPESQEC
jgi:WD40 repeat protein